jgi:hypothetical protein
MDKVSSYFASRKLNASTLKQLDNPKWIKWKLDNPDAADEEKRHFRIGGAIDCILTDPDRFKDEFVVLYSNRPSGKMGTFIDLLPLHLTEDSEIEEYKEAYNEVGYKVSLSAIIKSLWEKENYKNYYLSRKQSEGRSILTLDEWEEVQHCKEYLFNNPFTREYFLNFKADVEIQYQVPLYFEYMGESCKALLDGVVINHTKKTIQPFDLKTIGLSIKGFPRSYLTYGYYIQAAFYDAALRRCKSELSATANLDEYEILPMKFVVTEKKKTHSNPARIFPCTEDHIRSGYEGGWVDGKYYKGIDQLLDDYKWHRDNDLWDMSRSLYDNQGEALELPVLSKTNVV